jgi:riboflavin kinase/FMN adenylyltransferase
MSPETGTALALAPEASAARAAPSIAITPLDRVRPRSRAIAVGCFDGVHRGHRRVVDGCDTVLTFDPHPLAVLRPDQAPPLLTDRTHQARRLAASGIREIVVVPFDATWAAVPAAEFVDAVLVKLLRARLVSVGANFRFGASGRGSEATLAADPRFTTRVVPLAAAGGETVSSSRIRALIAAGNVGQAAHMLGEPHVQPALRQGTDLRFASDLAVPRAGRYSVLVDGVPGHWQADAVPGDTDANAGAPVEVTFLSRIAA